MPPIVMVVPGVAEEEAALGDGDGVELGVGDGVELGVGVEELSDGVGVGVDVGCASVSNVSAASRIALARDWLTCLSATSRRTSVSSWRTTCFRRV